MVTYDNHLVSILFIIIKFTPIRKIDKNVEKIRRNINKYNGTG